MESLRHQIQEITESQVLIDGQKISALKNYGIEQIAEPTGWQDRIYPRLNINCHAHTFGLGASDTYREIAWKDACQGASIRFANYAFLQFMLGSSRLQEMSIPGVGCIVIYFDEANKPRHSGIVIQTTPTIKVRSKWGTLGFFEHQELSHVPANYGPMVRYFHPLDIAVAEQNFLDYIDTLRVHAGEIA